MKTSYTNTALALALLCAATLLIVPAFIVDPQMTAHVSKDQSDLRRVEGSTSRPTSEQTREAYGQIEMGFEASSAKTESGVNFLARGAGYTLFLKPTEAVFVLKRHGGDANAQIRSELSSAEQALKTRRSQSDNVSDASLPEPPKVLRMKLVGADATAAVEGLNELEGKVNYFIGSDQAQWRTNISAFGRVQYREIYPGIDIVYYGNQRQLEYDFVVAPGRDARSIKLRFDGADKVEVDAAGDLLLTLGETVVRQPKPVLYQEVAGARRAVEGGYTVGAGRQIGFTVGEYDAQLPLMIDPVLVYSTYLGGSGADQGVDIAVDSAGSAYICGDTTSTNFPTANALDGTFGGGTFSGARDAFVTKLNPAGTALVYSTYLGGSGGGGDNGDDLCNKIKVDASGNAYVAGETHSADFPTANALQGTYGGGFSDAFVTKLNAAGSALVYSTFLGGTIFDAAHALTIDSAGNAYVTGRTTSADFPTVNPIQGTYSGGPGADAFVTKINAAGSALVYSTYLGGSGGNGFTAGFSIAVDSPGNAYLTGQTRATNFPMVNPIQGTFGGGFPDGDAFVTKLNAAGSALVYSTYLGGTDNDIGFEIAVDSAGSAHVVGSAFSNNFPVANAFQGTLSGTSDGFVTKLNAAGSAFAYSTYLGGTGSDSSNGIALDSAGNTYVALGTTSTDLPTVNPTQGTSGGGVDAFVAKFNAAGSALLFSTYLGGSGNDAALAIALDATGSAYVAGRTASTNFPTLNPIQNANGGGGNNDAFVTRISGSPTPTTVQFSQSSYSIVEACTSLSITITRSGDLSGTTTVDYRTNDGTATKRMDFNFAAGRLFFAPSEASKTIPLLISEDSRVEGMEQLTISLSNPTGGSLGAPATTTIDILDDNTEPATNIIDDPATFVCQQYHDFLNRDPEAGPDGIFGTADDAVQYYVNIINNYLNTSPCTPGDMECVKVIRGIVSANFLRSPEFQRKGNYVMFLYMVSLGQRAVTSSELSDLSKIERPLYEEFMTDLITISDPNDDAAIQEAKKVAFTDAWMLRPEIQAKYPAPPTMSHAQFVQALLDLAGVTNSQQSQLVQDLNNGTKTRAQVLRIIAESPEVNAKFYKPAFVTMEYVGYLHREPEDCHNSSNWTGGVSSNCGYIFHNNRFNLPFPPADVENIMARGFIESPEYRQRFGP